MQALTQDLAEKSARPRSMKREPGAAYPVYKRTVQTSGVHADRVVEQMDG
jgi:hypothetical protein